VLADAEDYADEKKKEKADKEFSNQTPLEIAGM